MNYDFGARHYDPRIGRWTGVDLLAETYENVSPYNYVANSPINNIDANGMDFSQGIPCPKWGEPGGGLFSAGANVLASFAAGLLGSVGNGPVALDKANAPGQQASFQSRSNITSSLNEDGTTVQQGGGDPGGKKKANANQGGDPHAAELAKYGQIVAVFNVSGGVQIVGGVAMEYGMLVTDKAYNQRYRTTYPIVYGLGASGGGNMGVIIGRGNYKPTFSDWKGYAYNGVSGSFEFFNGSWGHTSGYNVFTFGLGLGLNYKYTRFNGTYSPASFTTLMGDPYKNPQTTTDFSGIYIHSYGQH